MPGAEKGPHAGRAAAAARPIAALLPGISKRQACSREASRAPAEMVLSEIRVALGKTQTQMARAAGMKQPSWAKLEGQSDMLISTLRKVMKAMGGELELTVRFPQGRVRLKQFAFETTATK